MKTSCGVCCCGKVGGLGCGLWKWAATWFPWHLTAAFTASAERLAGILVVTVGLGLLAAVHLLGGLLAIWEKCFSVAS